MKISIVTISYNQAPFLARALNSVAEQDHPDIEYIVVDPGSTDGSREIIRQYADRIAVLIDEPDEGPADGLKKGFARVTGDVCGYINADDALLPGALARVAAEFAARPEVDVISGHGYVVDGTGRVLARRRSDRFHPWLYAYGGVLLMQQSSFFRRQAYERVGGFNTANRTCWDAELFVDMACAGSRFQVIDEYWSLFTLHEDSISGSGRLTEKYLADLRPLQARLLGHAPGP
ncbi:MAG: glycosyltransferase family 2 protein, partial [Alphaproteobacteria bacterium]